MGLETKLLAVQQALKCNKSQFNSFGNYHYRSCEDILEAVKPLCEQHGLTLTISDEIVVIGERYYVKATAKVTDTDKKETIEVSAYAREAESVKGMSEPQITGSSSSYARKYALNGLFLIDDTREVDSFNNSAKEQQAAKQGTKTAQAITVKKKAEQTTATKTEQPPTREQEKQRYLQETVKKANNLNAMSLLPGIIKSQYKVSSSKELTLEQARELFEKLDFLIDTEQILQEEQQAAK